MIFRGKSGNFRKSLLKRKDEDDFMHNYKGYF